MFILRDAEDRENTETAFDRWPITTNSTSDLLHLAVGWGGRWFPNNQGTTDSSMAARCPTAGPRKDFRLRQWCQGQAKRQMHPKARDYCRDIVGRPPVRVETRHRVRSQRTCIHVKDQRSSAERQAGGEEEGSLSKEAPEALQQPRRSS